MKRLLVVTLGLGLAFCTVATTFAQDTKKEESTMKKKARKAPNKKKGEETKKSS